MILTAEPHNSQSDRRIGFDRREYSYSDHMPERRSGEDRRKSTNNTPPSSSGDDGGSD